MPMTASRDSNIKRTQIAFWKTYGSDWLCLDWNFTRIRRAGSNSAGSPKRTGNVGGDGKPETFDFLGFTHISGKNNLGRFAVRRKTIGKRMRGKLRRIKTELHKRMHDPLSQTGQWLKSIVRGHLNYYAVPGNAASLSSFRHRLLVHWWHSVRRRSQKHPIPWTRMLDLATRWLPAPQVLHPYPDARFAATHPR